MNEIKPCTKSWIRPIKHKLRPYNADGTSYYLRALHVIVNMVDDVIVCSWN